jgi:putative intracellular protease/amidase
MIKQTIQRIAAFAAGGFILIFLAASTPARAADHMDAPILIVISNQDFWYADFSATRASLEARGLDVVVGAATTDTAYPQDQGTAATVMPDIALADVNAADYSAIVFVGGWGASSYQYDFPGTYNEPDYRPDPRFARLLNDLLGDFVARGRHVAAICHGVSVLAWARVDGVSPLRGRTVAGYAGSSPGFRLDGVKYPDGEVPLRWHLEMNGANVLTSGAIGDPLSTTDDVWVDGKIITAENYDSASRFAEVIAQALAGGHG